jgi:hypothetical protein
MELRAKQTTFATKTGNDNMKHILNVNNYEHGDCPKRGQYIVQI